MSSSSDSSSGDKLPTGYKPSQFDQDQAKSLGITDAQYFSLKQSIGSSVSSSGGDPTTGGQSEQAQDAARSSQASNISNFVQNVRAAGGSSSKDSSTAATSTARAPGPNDQLINIGAYVTGENPVYNPSPGKADPKTGITTTNPPVTGDKITTAPGGSWSSVPGLGMSASSVTDTKSPFYQPPPTVTGPIGTVSTPPPAGGSTYQTPTPTATTQATTAPAAPTISTADLPFAHNDLQALINSHLTAAASGASAAASTPYSVTPPPTGVASQMAQDIDKWVRGGASAAQAPVPQGPGGPVAIPSPGTPGSVKKV